MLAGAPMHPHIHAFRLSCKSFEFRETVETGILFCLYNLLHILCGLCENRISVNHQKPESPSNSKTFTAGTSFANNHLNGFFKHDLSRKDQIPMPPHTHAFIQSSFMSYRVPHSAYYCIGFEPDSSFKYSRNSFIK